MSFSFVPKRRNAPNAPNATPRCSFVNTRGFPCPNYIRHTYNGKDVCNVHLNTLKANEECTICLCSMDNPMGRIKLACGHYFHVNCLGQCIKAECPMCRREMLPTEKRRVYMHRVMPLIDPVFDMSSSRQAAIIEMVGGMVESISTMTDEEVDVCRAYTNIFVRGMQVLKNAPYPAINPSAIMFDWMNAMNGSFVHLANYGSYNGFELDYHFTTLTWGSQNPAFILPAHPQVGFLAPARAGAPSPELLNTPFAYIPMAHSPSPVLPGYYH